MYVLNTFYITSGPLRGHAMAARSGGTLETVTN